jgi:hypothetical protein
MGRAFCPKCGHFSFGYDPLIKISRCYSSRCEFVDIEKKFGQGLHENPFSHRDTSTSEIQLSNEQCLETGGMTGLK